MPRIPDTTNRQSAFLRALSRSRLGPSPEQWPSPTILRRWLRKEGFRRALDAVRETLRYEADLRLAYASANATSRIHHATLTLPAPQAPQPPAQGGSSHAPAADPPIDRSLREVVKMSHLRQRFSPKPPPPQPPQVDWDAFKNEEIELFRRLCPDRPLGEAIRFIEDRRAALRARGVLPPLLPKSAKPNSTPKGGPQ